MPSTTLPPWTNPDDLNRPPPVASARVFAYHCCHLDVGADSLPPPEPALGSFGEKIRQLRERRGVTLDAISNTTKISTRMLRALEDEHFDQLPGGVFNKGFVRAYARQIGLDEDEAVTDYLAALRENQVQQQAILPDLRGHANKPIHDNGHAADLSATEERRREDRRNDERRNEERRVPEDRRKESLAAQNMTSVPAPVAEVVPRAIPQVVSQNVVQSDPAESESAAPDASHSQVPWGMLVAAVVLIAAAMGFWNFRRHRDRGIESAPVVAAQPAAPIAQETAAVPASTVPATAAAEPQPSKASAPEDASPPAKAPTTTSANAVAAKPVSATPVESKPNPMPATAVSSSPTPPKISKKIVQAAPKPPRPFGLQIRASRTTWVAIVADGKPVARETLIAPAQTSVRAVHEIVVRAGNAAGVSFVLNGKEIPAEGGEGEVKTYVFDATSVHIAPNATGSDADR